MSHTEEPKDALRPEVRWTAGCLIAGAALAGLVILVLVIAYVLQPPTWLQIVLGVVLALGGAAFAVLIAQALARTPGRTRHLTAVDEGDAGDTPESGRR